MSDKKSKASWEKAKYSPRITSLEDERLKFQTNHALQHLNRIQTFSSDHCCSLQSTVRGESHINLLIAREACPCRS